MWISWAATQVCTPGTRGHVCTPPWAHGCVPLKGSSPNSGTPSFTFFVQSRFPNAPPILESHRPETLPCVECTSAFLCSSQGEHGLHLREDIPITALLWHLRHQLPGRLGHVPSAPIHRGLHARPAPGTFSVVSTLQMRGPGWGVAWDGHVVRWQICPWQKWASCVCGIIKET